MAPGCDAAAAAPAADLTPLLASGACASDASLLVFVNGAKHALPPGRAEATLLQFLRGAFLLRRARALHPSSILTSR
jgi:hypothetical protein